jgi:hypothetical protein
MMALIAFAMLATGQEAAGTRTPPMVVQRQIDASPAVSRAVMAEFAGCVVRRKHDVAAEVVLDPSQQLGSEDNKGLFISDCMPSGARMRAKAAQMRYGLAEALVLADVKAAPADLSDVAPLQHPPFVDASMPAAVAADPERVARWQAFAEAARAYASLAPIGECVVRANPAGSFALLKTAVESDEEKAALGAIAPALPGCVKKGEQLSVNRFNLRGTIALNFYRLAQAPRVAAKPGGAE